MLSEGTIQAFAARISGGLLQPGDSEYDEARKVYNGMIDRHPRLIARCNTVDDVVEGVRFARENDLLLAVRGGGHNAGGLGVCDDGLVLDLSPMKGINVDPAAGTVRVEAGSTWNEVDSATHPHGLAVPTGIISSTGVAGLTLGGGHGYLARKYGLTVDSLLAADMVLADGRVVTASETENPDLFWAIRGGGGNFGVVTAFTYKGRPVRDVVGGPTLWPIERAQRSCAGTMVSSGKRPRDLYGFFLFLTVPPGPPFPEALHLKKMCGIVWCYSGPKKDADAAFEPVRALEPALYGVQAMPFPALQSAFDALYPTGLQWYWKGDFSRGLSEEAIAAHVKHGSQLPSMQSSMHIYPINGAVHRVDQGDTAWSYRDVDYSQVIVGVDPDPANAAKITRWTKEYWEAIHPYSAGAAYVNFMMDDEGQERIKASYRGNYARLVEVKNRYDPHNLFRVNQNIKPTV